MRYALAMLVSVSLLTETAHADVDLPYFESISEKDLCGGVPDKCQPNASRLWFRVADPVDYEGDPDSFLGSRIKTIYSPEKCVPSLSPGDYSVLGESVVTGKIIASSAPGLKAAINVDLKKVAEMLGASLPDDLKAKLTAKLGVDVTNKLQQTATIKYRRIQIKTAFKQGNLATCLAKVPKSEKVITGISVITVNGEWTKTKIIEALNSIELDASFAALGGDVKAAYDQNKTKALSGTLPETSFVIMASYERGRA